MLPESPEVADGAADPAALSYVRCTVVVVDLVESVRIMAEHEEGVIAHWRRFVREVLDQDLPAGGARMVKSLGDGLLLTFPSVGSALPFVFGVHKRLRALGAPRPGGEALQVRVGLHHAAVAVDHVDIYGSAVNLAARLTSLADPGGVVATADVVEELIVDVDARVRDLGDCFLKHWPQPVRAYRLAEVIERQVVPLPFGMGEGSQGAPGDVGRPRVAVLTPVGEDHAPSLLATLLADELAVHLAAQHSLEVVSRMSTRRLGDVDPRRSVLALSAHYVVAGACLMLGPRLRATLELIHLVDEGIVWSQAFEFDKQAFIQEPAEAIRGVAAEVLCAIEAHETRRVKTLPLASLDSYELMLGGVRLMHRLSRTDFLRAHDSLDTVVARHPRHPDSYAWLAKWHVLSVHQGWSEDVPRSMSRAADMARRALDLDDGCGLALSIGAMVKMFGDRDLDQAEAMFDRALELQPNEPLAWLLKGMVHAFRGEGEMAIRHTSQATTLSPLDPMRYYFDSLSASAHAAAGQYAASIELAERSLRANTQHASTWRILAISFAMQDQLKAASEAVRRLMVLEPAFTVALFLARSPSADHEIGRRFASALARAGVPKG